jgi:hypothetical protein
MEDDTSAAYWYPKPPLGLEGFGIGCYFYSQIWFYMAPGDGRDRAGTRKRPQNNPWSIVNSTRKKKI